MASSNEPEKEKNSDEEVEEEGKIPVLTVLKNESILKNIFIVNKPPEPEQHHSPRRRRRRRDYEDTLLVGRHPDCDLMLTHPSISRYHLHIRSIPSSLSFSVVDLSSVHGTWVSGRKIEAGVRVEMKEGDMLRIGVSSRVYRLHWIPISRAYDLENPFVPELHALVQQQQREEEEEEEDDDDDEEEEAPQVGEEREQELNSCPVDMEDMLSVDSVLECISSLFLDENVELTVKEEEIPASPQMLKEKSSFCCLDDKEEIQSADSVLQCINSLFLDKNVELFVKEEIISLDEKFGVPSDTFGSETAYWPACDVEDKQSDSLNQVPSPTFVESVVECDNTLSENLPGEECSSVVESVSGVKRLQIQSPHDTFSSPLPPKEENSFEKSDTFGSETAYWPTSDVEDKHSDSLNQVPSPTFVESVVECDNTLSENLSGEECLSVVESVSGAKRLEIQSPHDTFSSPLPPKEENSFEKHQASFQRLSPTYAESVVECDNTLAEYLYEDECFLEASSGIERVQIQSPQDTFNSPILPRVENSFEKHESSVQVLSPSYAPESVDQTFRVENSFEKHGSSFQVLSPAYVPESPAFAPKSVGKENSFEKHGSSFKESQTPVPDMEILESCKGTTEKSSKFRNIWSRRGKASCSPLIQTRNSVLKCTANADNEAAVSDNNNIINKAISKDLLSVLDMEEEIFTPDKENFSPNMLQLRFLKKSGKLEETKHSKSQMSRSSKDTTVSSDLSSVLDGEKEEEEEIYTLDKENFSPNTLQLGFLKKSGKLEETKHSKSQMSRSSKDTTVSSDLSSVLDGEKEEEEEIYTLDKENFSPNTLQLGFLKKSGKLEDTKHFMSQRSHSSKDKTVSKDLFSVFDLEREEEEEIIFTPDKENFSPNTLHLLRMKKKGKLEEIKHSKSRLSPNPKVNFGPNIYLDESTSPTSNKENQTSKRVQDQKLQRKPFGTQIKLTQEQDVNALKNSVVRVPFQSLRNSGSKGRPGTSCPVSAEKSIHVSDCGQISDQHNNPPDTSVVQKRSWDMIVDTTTLMNKESRKALQLLQGLKGTRLIVPRFVIRELQSMKQQYSFFRRISEASLALEWIEECMMNTNWWIHIQSSVDEGRLIAPTPPVSPQTQYGEESWSFHGGIGSSMEIPTPTVEDHILDFTLLYKRKQNDGQLVLLSEDVTLKINCMEEGLLCEPVQEFRESLVNPFSERFLWKNSSPRGQTWRCEDDVVLRERYCRLPLRKSSKGAASGLKLILLHNSQYGH